MTTSPRRVRLAAWFVAVGLLAGVQMPACAPESTCLRNSDCEDGYQCAAGTCTISVPVDAGVPDTSTPSDSGPSGDANADASEDANDDTSNLDDAASDSNGDARDAAADASADAKADGSTDAASDGPHTDGATGDAAPHDGAVDAPGDGSTKG